jgi:transcriptional regulator with XRE-family HTH domain
MGDMISTSELGLKIKKARQHSGLSQERLAELVGVSFQQIQKYENGQTTLNILKLQLIAKALNHPVKEFFQDVADGRSNLTVEEMELLQAYRKIKNTQLRGAVLSVVNNINRKAR